MVKNYKGQAATEFFAYATIFLLLVIVTTASVFVVQDSERAYYQHRYLVEVGQKFTSSYNLVVSAGNGFQYSMDFPKTILGYPYNVTFVENSTIMIEWSSPSNNFFYPYPMASSSLEFGGCIVEDPPNHLGLLKSNEGDNVLIFSNDGSTIMIEQGGCP